MIPLRRSKNLFWPGLTITGGAAFFEAAPRPLPDPVNAVPEACPRATRLRASSMRASAEAQGVPSRVQAPAVRAGLPPAGETRLRRRTPVRERGEAACRAGSSYRGRTR